MLVNVVVVGGAGTVLIIVEIELTLVVIVDPIMTVVKIVFVVTELIVVPIVFVFVGVSMNSVLNTVMGQTACGSETLNLMAKM